MLQQKSCNKLQIGTLEKQFCSISVTGRRPHGNIICLFLHKYAGFEQSVCLFKKFQPFIVSKTST